MNLDMPLDDIIKFNKQSSRGGGGGPARRGGRGRGTPGGGSLGGSRGGGRTGAFLRPRRPSAFQLAKSSLFRRPDGWRQDLFEDAVGSTLGIETSTKLFISNLDHGVSNDDIKELFSEMGYLKHCGIHYDRSGRSIGTADVVFIRRPDAIAAMKQYNNVQLDGKPMKIELIGTNILPSAVGGTYGSAPLRRGLPPSAMRGRGGRARGRGFGFRRFGGRGRGRGRRPPMEDKKGPNAEALDADLEKYHKNAMQTS